MTYLYDFLAQTSKVIFEFALPNADKWNAVLDHKFVVALISYDRLWLVMPVIAVELNDQIQRGNVGINIIGANMILLSEIKFHHFQKLIAYDFQRRAFGAFFSAFPRAIFCALVVIGWLDSFLLSATPTDYRDTFSLAVSAETSVATKVRLSQLRLYSVDKLAAIAASYCFTILLDIGSLLRGMLGSAFSRAEISFSWPYQVCLLPKFLLAVIARNKRACPVGVICSASRGIVTWFAAIQVWFMGIIIRLKAVVAMGTHVSFLGHDLIIPQIG